VYVDPPTDAPELPCSWSMRRPEQFSSIQDHSPTVVDAMDHEKPIIASPFVFLRCMADDASFAP